jgi:nucleoside-diphosphate-sugar epimerase
MDILVSGAGGFIGGAVAQTLAADPSVTVRGGTRDGRALGAGIAACQVDVCDQTSLNEALIRADAVVHCAVGDRRTTVEGTTKLLQAAIQARVRRVVHLSSIAVYGSAAGSVDETAALVSPVGRGYAHWKAAAEAACRDAAAAGCEVVMLRPAIVYGPGCEQWITQPARRLLSGDWGGLGELGNGICNPVHVRDVAAACAAAISAPDMGDCPAFNLSGPESLTWNAWHARLAALLGCPHLAEISASAWRRRTIAALPFKVLAKLRPGAGKLFERFTLAAPAPSELTLFALAATYSIGKAAARLGWQPRIGLAEGLAECLSSLRSNGIVP